MAKINTKGLDEYLQRLEKLSDNPDKAIKAVVYKMAEPVADQIRANIQSMSTVSENENIRAFRKGEKAHLSDLQKAGLLEGLGVARIGPVFSQDISTSIGFDGYNAIRTDRWPNGQPNMMIARSLESGTSFMDKQPFVRPAVNATRAKAITAGQKKFEELTQKAMK